MAITFVDEVYTGGTPTGTALAVTMPTGIVVGDLLLVCIQSYGAAATAAMTAVPSGWTLLKENSYTHSATAAPQSLRVYYKIATGSEGASQTWTVPVTGTGLYPTSAEAWRSTAPSTFQVTANASTTGVATWTSQPYSAVVAGMVSVSFFDISGGTADSIDAGSTLRSTTLVQTPLAVDRPVVASGMTTGSTVNRATAPDSMASVTIGIRPTNVAPNVAVLTGIGDAGLSGGVVDLAVTNRATWTFSDPDEDLPRPEGQSGFDIRHRVVGAPGWTTINQPANTNSYYDFPGSTFTASDREWQVLPYDLAGLPAPSWSSSAFFTAAVAPVAPVITAPSDGATLTAIVNTVSWTHASQAAYRVMRVADDGGVADPSVIYYDSGVVADAVTQSVSVSFPVNNRTEHVLVLVRNAAGLWSPVDDAEVLVDYVEPPAPVVTLSTDAATGSMLVEWDTPAPAGGEPTPTYVDIWVDDGGDIGDERKAAGLSVDGQWAYMTPRSGRDYTTHIRVISYTADGIPSA